MHRRLTLRRETVLWLGVALLVAGAFLALRIAVGGGVQAQSAAWPTPPPGPAFAPPSPEEAQASIRFTARRPGSQVAFVRPSWPGHIPLIPPIPSTEITFDQETGIGPPVTLRIDAGTFERAVQLRITPVTMTAIPGTNGNALGAFELELFDVEARELAMPPQRPIQLTMPTSGFTAGGIQGARLLFAMVEGGRLRWLVNSFNADEQRLTTRLVQLGTVVLLTDMP